MQKEVRDLLLRHDDTEGYEVPGNNWRKFPYDELAASVRQIQAELEKLLDVNFERDGQVQDASFHDQLGILHPHPQNDGAGGFHFCEVAIRFSNFGRLFTISTGFEAIPPRFRPEEMVALIERHGWSYVPAQELDAPYDGVNSKLRQEGISWWIRYFDYL